MADDTSLIDEQAEADEQEEEQASRSKQSKQRKGTSTEVKMLQRSIGVIGGCLGSSFLIIVALTMAVAVGTALIHPDSAGGNTNLTTYVPGNCSVNRVEFTGQYSQAQLTQIFGNPGTASDHPDLRLVGINFNGHSVQVSPKIADCLSAVAQQIKSNNITYNIREMGCYRFDSDNGSSNIGLRSYHTYGAACDINWDTNPFVTCGESCPYPYNPNCQPGGHCHDIPDTIVEAFAQHGFSWGGKWHSVRDYMHFEWHGVTP